MVLIRAPLIAAAGSGYGLDAWVAAYGAKRDITPHGGFRNPSNNTLHSDALNSRHIYGDAADVGNTTAGGGSDPNDYADPANAARYADWIAMEAAASAAHLDWTELKTGPCRIGCVHIDWRNHSGGYQ